MLPYKSTKIDSALLYLARRNWSRIHHFKRSLLKLPNCKYTKDEQSYENEYRKMKLPEKFRKPILKDLKLPEIET